MWDISIYIMTSCIRRLSLYIRLQHACISLDDVSSHTFFCMCKLLINSHSYILLLQSQWGLVEVQCKLQASAHLLCLILFFFFFFEMQFMESHCLGSLEYAITLLLIGTCYIAIFLFAVCCLVALCTMFDNLLILYFLSKSPVNQATSKAMLTQMISIVFRRMESEPVKKFRISCLVENDSLSLRLLLYFLDSRFLYHLQALWLKIRLHLSQRNLKMEKYLLIAKMRKKLLWVMHCPWIGLLKHLQHLLKSFRILQVEQILRYWNWISCCYQNFQMCLMHWFHLIPRVILQGLEAVLDKAVELEDGKKVSRFVKLALSCA